jgi:hypothetical protein
MVQESGDKVMSMVFFSFIVAKDCTGFMHAFPGLPDIEKRELYGLVMRMGA